MAKTETVKIFEVFKICNEGHKMLSDLFLDVFSMLVGLNHTAILSLNMLKLETDYCKFGIKCCNFNFVIIAPRQSVLIFNYTIINLYNSDVDLFIVKGEAV